MSTLVYDIGLHDGRDTGHYLREGSRVVAIDANPVMCAAAEANFRDYIRTGQLKVINRGVAEHNGQLEFWVCDDVSEWSSFHRDIASRNGVKHHAITVDCVPIIDIIDEFGVGDYMKIDIEGNDRICIAGLTCATAPKYISIEGRAALRLGMPMFDSECQLSFFQYRDEPKHADLSECAPVIEIAHFPDNPRRDRMAPGGFGQLGLQLAGESLGAGKNLPAPGSFKSQRGFLTGLGAPPIPMCFSKSLPPATAFARACAA